MKYILKKKIEGTDLIVGKVIENTTDKYSSFVDRLLSDPLQLHNLLLNGTIEKVDENRNRVLSVVMYNDDMDTNEYLFQESMIEAQAQEVANQIKELLIKSHGEHN